MFQMPLPIITVDNDVIQIGSDMRGIWPEDLVHEKLEGSGSQNTRMEG